MNDKTQADEDKPPIAMKMCLVTLSIWEKAEESNGPENYKIPERYLLERYSGQSEINGRGFAQCNSRRM